MRTRRSTMFGKPFHFRPVARLTLRNKLVYYSAEYTSQTFFPSPQDEFKSNSISRREALMLCAVRGDSTRSKKKGNA